MFGLGIAVVAFFITLGSGLVLTGAIYFGYRLARGKPIPFKKLGTGDYVLYHLVSADWKPDGGMAYVLISRAGTNRVNYVSLPVRSLRGYNNEQMTQDLARAAMRFGGGVVEVVEKRGEHLLRFQRSLPPAEVAVFEPQHLAASPAAPALPVAVPGVPITEQPTVILDPGVIPSETRSAGQNGHGDEVLPEVQPAPAKHL